MKRIFTKKEIYRVKSQMIDPSSMGEPITEDEFLKRGMAHYARKQYNAAEADLKAAIAKERGSIDANYGLGMVYKALGNKTGATNAFNQVIELIAEDANGKSTKTDMIRRLALGHINMINHGDWNLEKEIWKRIA